ncbi:MAG TPA: VIT family protein [Paracoccus sp. (in: a-proteobacteria)]|uniref:VIT1/CCC1 transporter family protein n=1 Tax=uncultured Paracoccus sp. TaxID=189685 RepID=UPI002605768F|nr:VIT family protein [uncultured Paracoccus sp.]HMQ40482.1 VIT family protein [Paracoccus sp. (in: a-proteobacteria)]HMR34975.1 VIT family protein [Paracoccus sp. (in: a-proteobacteria)]
MSSQDHAASAHPDEPHFVSRSGWLRAAVLGANDGIVSTASLLVGIAAASSDRPAILLAGLAGMTAGALSMAAGEYVSVSSQSDIERADIERERVALRDDPETELAELAEIYEERGLSKDTAMLVAKELTEHDALGAHVRDELGLSEIHTANPVQAALASAAAFAAGAALPVAGAILAPQNLIIPVVFVATLLALTVLGAIGARAGGAPATRPILRILFWSAIAMAATALIGKIFGVSVG